MELLSQNISLCHISLFKIANAKQFINRKIKIMHTTHPLRAADWDASEEGRICGSNEFDMTIVCKINVHSFPVT